MEWKLLYCWALKLKKVNLSSVRRFGGKVINSRKQDSRSSFGIIFDIDGVLARGQDAIPSAVKAFRHLVDSHGKFLIPTVFVTNSSHGPCTKKAQQLTKWLEVMISEEQVVMAYSPLKMFTEYFDRRTLVCGQGNFYEIVVDELGFKNVCTLADVKKAFPLLDANNHQLVLTKKSSNYNFQQVEAVILLGEPLEWETALQLLIDLLLTNGLPSHAPTLDHYPHIPLIACNMDLQWMAEDSMPRFGHGAFLLCLESLYKKISGHDLIYTALIGKPSLITYKYAQKMLQKHAKQIGVHCNIEKVYAFGDNLNTDVYGANYYNQVLASEKAAGGTSSCDSILVKTGVYGGETHTFLNHFPRDFQPANMELCTPKYLVDDVYEGIKLILKEEKLL